VANFHLLRTDPLQFLRKISMLMAGLVIFSLAMVLSLKCNLGASSWAVFHDGISRQTPLTLGQATILVGVVMVFISWAFGIKPGFGTVANMLLVGLWTDVILWSNLIPEAQSYPARIAMLLAAVVTLGFASALYIKPGFGAGPRDSFMLAITRLTNLRVSVVRWSIEATVILIGIALGGDFGVGTIVFSMLIGASVGFFFSLFNIQTRRPVQTPVSAGGD
jgi:uncharacterized membrane protein YczE